jgi:Flp pilus assembly pilin Flp
MHRQFTRGNRRGQGSVEWLLILVLVAIIVQAATSRTGAQVEKLFQANADAIGVEFRAGPASEVVASAADEGGIAASGRIARDRSGLLAKGTPDR